jgi:hypothetical protein
MSPRRAALIGGSGPVGFLAVAFVMAAVRPDLIRAQGWASWPSSMATGGLPASIPQTLAFLWLGGCYLVFALGALRPVLRSPAVTLGFVAVACGDALLAFTTDVPGVHPTWHGSIHLVAVLLATAATVFATAASLVAVRGRSGWRPWRIGAAFIFAAALIGLVGGFDRGWAKVAYVLGITLPVLALVFCVRQAPARSDPSPRGR